MFKTICLAMRVSIISIIINILLSIFKLIAGIVGRSSAMISDAIHSMSDIFSTIIVIIGVNLSNKKADEKHPYGHERFECIAGIILSFILAMTGLLIGYQGIIKIIQGVNNELAIPSFIALIASLVSIIVKELMYWYTYFAAKKISSSALMADAWHHRSDALSSIGSLVGIGGAMLGFSLLDPIASLIICLLILKAAYDILIDGISRVIDKSCSSEIIDNIKSIALSVDKVKGIAHIRTRLFGNKIYINLIILLDECLSFKEAYLISVKVHDEIEEKIDNVKHCFIQIKPNNN